MPSCTGSVDLTVYIGYISTRSSSKGLVLATEWGRTRTCHAGKQGAPTPPESEGEGKGY